MVVGDVGDVHGDVVLDKVMVMWLLVMLWMLLVMWTGHVCMRSHFMLMLK